MNAVASAPLAVTGWLHPAEPEPEAGLRLILLHHSGGNATLYREWPALLPGDVSCQAVQLPGRHVRGQEQPYTRLEPLVDALAEVLAAELDDRPYALFGHSMGALLGYRLAVRAGAPGLPAPALLAVSGWAPEGFGWAAGGFGSPVVPERATDAEIVRAMAALGSLPERVAADGELLAAAVRTMRADSGVCADYRDDGAALCCPVVGYSGLDDPLLAPDAMNSWAGRTDRYLGTRRYPGGHFFLGDHAPAVTGDLVQLLRRHGTA